MYENSNCTHEVYENGCARLRYYPSCHCCMDTIGPPPVDGYFICCRAYGTWNNKKVDFLYMSPLLVNSIDVRIHIPEDTETGTPASHVPFEQWTASKCEQTDATGHCISNPRTQFLCDARPTECSAPPPSPPPCGEGTTWDSTTGQCEIACDEASNGRRMTDQDFRLPALA